MQEVIQLLSEYGYIILFIYTLGGGMVAILGAGVLSYIGKMDLSLCIVIATISNTIGDSLVFYVTRYNKSSLQPYIKSHKRKLAYAFVLMKKNGDVIIFIKKFIYGLKNLVTVAISLTGYPFYKFNIINFVSSAIWAIILGVSGYYFGSVFVLAGDYLSVNSWIMPICMLCILFIIWKFLEKKTMKGR